MASRAYLNNPGKSPHLKTLSLNHICSLAISDSIHGFHRSTCVYLGGGLGGEELFNLPPAIFHSTLYLLAKKRRELWEVASPAP